MYAKYGSIEESTLVFDNRPEPNLVSWNAVIIGYSQHGYCRKVLELFDQMQDSGINPDEITFIGVLSACAHIGHVNIGYHLIFPWCGMLAPCLFPLNTKS